METTTTNATNDYGSLQLQERDRELWHLARKRASFKWSLISYFAVNAMLVAIWYLTSGPGTYFWPVWPMLGWGVGMVMHYLGAYHSHNLFSTEKEYQKLKNQHNNN